MESAGKVQFLPKRWEVRYVIEEEFKVITHTNYKTVGTRRCEESE
jgi:hypothetical protein